MGGNAFVDTVKLSQADWDSVNTALSEIALECALVGRAQFKCVKDFHGDFDFEVQYSNDEALQLLHERLCARFDVTDVRGRLAVDTTANYLTGDRHQIDVHRSEQLDLRIMVTAYHDMQTLINRMLDRGVCKLTHNGIVSSNDGGFVICKDVGRIATYLDLPSDVFVTRRPYRFEDVVNLFIQNGKHDWHAIAKSFSDKSLQKAIIKAFVHAATPLPPSPSPAVFLNALQGFDKEEEFATHVAELRRAQAMKKAAKLKFNTLDVYNAVGDIDMTTASRLFRSFAARYPNFDQYRSETPRQAILCDFASSRILPNDSDDEASGSRLL